MSVEEEENTEATVTKDTTGLDMVTLEIDSLSDGFLDSLDLNRDIPIRFPSTSRPSVNTLPFWSRLALRCAMRCFSTE